MQNPNIKGAGDSLIGADESTQQDTDVLELLQLLETTTPVIPDALMDRYMIKAGVECDDIRLKRLVALIGQKFITDIANDAMHYTRMRQGNVGGGGSASTPGGARGKRVLLTLEDLSAALADYGINIRRPAYYT